MINYLKKTAICSLFYFFAPHFLRMSRILILYFVFIIWSFAQDRPRNNNTDNSPVITTDQQKVPSNNPNQRQGVNSNNNSTSNNAPKAKIEQYKFYKVEKDTIILDTSLTIQSEYKYNLYRRDLFGYQPFANEGQPLNILDFSLNDSSLLPQFGFKAKHHNYLQIKDITYHQVATPLTELYYKTVMEQGQSIDAFFTLNTNERTNYSIAYKGLRSLGVYLNNLSSHGNFRFSTNYQTKNKRYQLYAHIAAQDLTNQENGGIQLIDNFTSGNQNFTDRSRIEVWLRDARSLLQGNRYFLSHSFKLRPNKKETNMVISHEGFHENKFYEFTQNNLFTNVPESGPVIRFGEAFVQGNLRDLSEFNQTYQKVQLALTNKTYGKLFFYTDFLQNNYFYNRVLLQNEVLIPNRIQDNIQTIGARYQFNRKKFLFDFGFQNGITNADVTKIDANIKYVPNEKYALLFEGTFQKTLADVNFRLFQSNFVHYNWFNQFNNPGVLKTKFTFENPWLGVEGNYQILTDYLYFSDTASPESMQQLIKPFQFTGSIHWFSIKAFKEFSYKKWAWNNTMLYQATDASTSILNVPQLTARSTLYYSGTLFKKAMNFQSGVHVHYFSEYFANEYSPVIGDFFVQNTQAIGNFPMVDLFFNARVRQTRIFFKAEHLNALFTKQPNYFTTPTQPYRDFIIRFGLVWNFFQ